MLAGLLLAEVLMRILGLQLAPILEWPDWEAQNKVAAMERLAGRGGASVVFIGSSMVNAGFDPAALTETLGDDRPVFKASLQGCHITSSELWALHVAVPLLRPRVVVIGTDGFELNTTQSQEKIFYGALTGSRGYRRYA